MPPTRRTSPIVPGGAQPRPPAVPPPPPVVTPPPVAAPTPPPPPPVAPALPGVLPGWDATKWANPDHNTTKYQVGRLLANYAPTTANFDTVFHELLSLFPGITKGTSGRIHGLPDTYGPVDILEAANAGGRAWQWIDTGAVPTAGVGTGTGTAPGLGGGTGTGTGSLGGYTDINSLLNSFGTPGGPFSIASSYLDPDTQALLNFVRDRVQTLTTPTLDPAMEAYIHAARTFGERLNTPWTNPQSARATGTLEQILRDVTGQPFTDSQSAALRAQAFDQLEQDRSAATRRATAQMAALGHGRESGTIADVLSQVDRGYDAARAGQNRDLLVRGIDQTNRNRETAMTVTDLLRSIAGQDFALNEARGAQSVGALQEVANARARQRAENEGRQATALSLSSIPVQLADSRLQTALQVLGMSQGVNPTNIFNSLASLLQSTQANSLAQNQNNSSMWLGLGQLLGNMPMGSQTT